MAAVESSIKAQKHWKQTPISTRIQIITKFVDCLLAKKEDIVTELSHLIGRPRKQNYNEMKGFEFRARYLISIAESSLSDIVVEDTEDFQRFMTREPLGHFQVNLGLSL